MLCYVMLFYFMVDITRRKKANTEEVHSPAGRRWCCYRVLQSCLCNRRRRRGELCYLTLSLVCKAANEIKTEVLKNSKRIG
jgi:hypothetical protein